MFQRAGGPHQLPSWLATAQTATAVASGQRGAPRAPSGSPMAVRSHQGAQPQPRIRFECSLQAAFRGRVR
eukprot:11459962-Alexandrium_andersonii.AAC.1